MPHCLQKCTVFIYNRQKLLFSTRRHTIQQFVKRPKDIHNFKNTGTTSLALKPWSKNVLHSV